MKKNFSKTAFTLLELIVSLSLIGIILLGIISINTVLNYNNQDYGQRYLVKSETQTTLNHILNNASLAVGNTVVDPYGNIEQGILIGAAVGDANSFCIHQDIPVPPQVPLAGYNIDNTPVNNPASAPPNYSNSRWLCYTRYPSSDLTYPYQIRYCAMPYIDSASNRGAANCLSGTETVGPFYLGTAYSIVTPVPTFTSTTGFSITIQNCLNNSLASCNSSGTSTDPANNPEVQVSGSVIPFQESF